MPLAVQSPRKSINAAATAAVAKPNGRLPVAAVTRDPANLPAGKETIPTEYALKQNYPNPFNPSTTIQFSIPQTEYVTLKVYNLLGQEVAKLASKEFNAGNYTYNWDASDMAGGIYFYQLEAGTYFETRKMVLIK